MALSRKRYMLSNLLSLKIVSNLHMCISSQRRFMGSSKLQEHGMNACETFLSLMASKLVKLTLLSSLKLLLKTCLYAKFMLMILYLGLLTSHLVKSLVGLWYRNSRCLMGELKYFLGFQIKQLQEGTFICQTKYIQDILKKFGMKNAKPIKTPMGTNGHLDLDTGGKSVDQKVYRSMIGSLLYLCALRPDIMFSICMCARFQANPKEVHLRVVKRIMRYLVYTHKFGLWYPEGSTFDLIGYSDADYAGCKIDRKSTSETCQFLGRSLVSWASKKQNSIALSTAEAEYIVAGHCCTQLIWMRQTLRDYGYKLSKVPLLCDNESAIRMADNPVEHSRTKHIDIRYHFLRYHQQKGISKLLMLTPTTN
jgi:hypothetical protein